MLPLVRHLRTLSPVRHLRTPLILTLIVSGSSMGAVVLAVVVGSSTDTAGPVAADSLTGTVGLVVLDSSMDSYFPADRKLQLTVLPVP